MRWSHALDVQSWVHDVLRAPHHLFGLLIYSLLRSSPYEIAFGLSWAQGLFLYQKQIGNANSNFYWFSYAYVQFPCSGVPLDQPIFF